jgi:hypothetical protein
MDHLLKDISFDDIPAFLGGGLQLYNEPYIFDTSVDGPLAYPGCEEDSIPFIEKRIDFEESQRQNETNYCYFYNGITPSDSVYTSPASTSVRVTVEEVPALSVNIVQPSSTTFSDMQKISELHEYSSSAITAMGVFSDDHSLSASSRSAALEKNTFYKYLPDSGLPTDKRQTMTMTMTMTGFLRFFFLHHCFQQNPFLSCISFCLVGFIIMFHPNFSRYFIPTLIFSIFFVIAVTER